MSIGVQVGFMVLVVIFAGTVSELSNAICDWTDCDREKARDKLEKAVRFLNNHHLEINFLTTIVLMICINAGWCEIAQ